MESNAGALAGIGVVVTRPALQATNLCALIEQHGGNAVTFPVINITPPDDGAWLSVRQLQTVDLMIFVSVHAVHAVAEMLARHQLKIPARARVAAVGPKTAAQCERASIRVDFVAREIINSEGLLDALRDLDVAGRNILIFRGQSGRELIKQGLEARGGKVRYVECYRREVAKPSEAELQSLLARWRKNEIHSVVIGSAAVMDALLELIGTHHRALPDATAIFAYSQRVAAHCRATGLRADIRVAEKPTDESMVDAIIQWAAARVG